MKVIAVLNQKGGVGKTTIATNLARALQIAGADVVLVDADPQGSARDWHAARDDQPVRLEVIDRPVLEKSLRRVRADFAVIDGAPRLKEHVISALRVADLVLVPVQPAAFDVWATDALVEWIEEGRKVKSLQAAFVVSRATPGTVLGREIDGALADYQLPVLASRTMSRQIYPRVGQIGGTVLDVPKSAAAIEIKALAAEVTDVLKYGHQEISKP